MVEVARKKGSEFTVTVSEGSSSSTHQVTLDEAYYQQLTGGKISPEDLIKKSFEFLLKRESKESILSRFDMRVISKYFPEYENKIRS